MRQSSPMMTESRCSAPSGQGDLHDAGGVGAELVVDRSTIAAEGEEVDHPTVEVMIEVRAAIERGKSARRYRSPPMAEPGCGLVVCVDIDGRRDWPWSVR